VVAEDDHPPFEIADVRVAPLAAGLEAPFEHGARDVDRTGHDAVALARELGADVDDQPARFRCRAGRRGLEALDPSPRLVEELVERHPGSTVSRW
jgi:hypothetical protein